METENQTIEKRKGETETGRKRKVRWKEGQKGGKKREK